MLSRELGSDVIDASLKADQATFFHVVSLPTVERALPAKDVGSLALLTLWALAHIMIKAPYYGKAPYGSITPQYYYMALCFRRVLYLARLSGSLKDRPTRHFQAEAWATIAG